MPEICAADTSWINTCTILVHISLNFWLAIIKVLQYSDKVNKRPQHIQCFPLWHQLNPYDYREISHISLLYHCDNPTLNIAIHRCVINISNFKMILKFLTTVFTVQNLNVLVIRDACWNKVKSYFLVFVLNLMLFWNHQVILVPFILGSLLK